MAAAKTLQLRPAAPTGLTASATGSDQITLTWIDNSNNEAGFNILRRTGNNGSFTQVGSVGPHTGTGGTVTFTDMGLAAGTTSSYVVVAFNDGGNSNQSRIAGSTTLRAAPAPPTNLVARQRLQQDHADVDRQQPEPEQPGVGDRLQGLPLQQQRRQLPTAHHHPGQRPDLRGHVGAVEHGLRLPRGGDQQRQANSAPSNNSSATTLPAAPTNLQVTTPPAPKAATQLVLTWTDNSAKTSAFKVEQSNDGGASSPRSR